MGEFDLIERYFKSAAPRRDGVDLGIGDDCALLAPAPGMQVAVSADMLVEGRHFLSTVNPEALGHKALAVNLSDLAACGAKPVAFTLALSLPRVDESWLEGFSRGLFALASAHDCALIGGDTTAGPLNICITVFGQIPKGQALLRSGAQLGDDIYVSGWPGQARLALEAFRGTVSLPEAMWTRMRARMERPEPRVALGLALRTIATSAVDVSDGLLGDLGHILQRSGLAAEIDLNTINRIAFDAGFMPGNGQFSSKFMQEMVLAGGDDYELVFTSSPNERSAIQALSKQLNLPLNRIGCTRVGSGITLIDEQGRSLPNEFQSFDHFKA